MESVGKFVENPTQNELYEAYCQKLSSSILNSSPNVSLMRGSVEGANCVKRKLKNHAYLSDPGSEMGVGTTNDIADDTL
jgi:hypothetical protein